MSTADFPYNAGGFTPTASYAHQPYPGPGPYVATIVSHYNPDLGGTLSVVLDKGMQSAAAGPDTSGSKVGSGNSGIVYQARYLSPFYGTTPRQAQGKNQRDESDSVKSYGMFMVPPDVGNKVLVVFADGSGDHCYWVGCVPTPKQNNSLFGPVGNSNTTDLPQVQKNVAGQSNGRVATVEVNPHFPDTSNPAASDQNIQRAIDFETNQRLATSGLLQDEARGLPSSSPRRNLPASVFGFSSPGPWRVGGKKQLLGVTGDEKWTYTQRMGGSSIVFDDGETGTGADGKEGIVGEHLRIRTRTGHQIVMHNSQDFIYIATGKGTAWIELTGNGKIDIFAEDSVSIHSTQDFNFRADRDINLEAGRSIQMRSVNGSIAMESSTDVSILSYLDTSISSRLGGISMDAGNPANLFFGGKIKMKGFGGIDMLSGSVAPIPNFFARSNIWYSGSKTETVLGLGWTVNSVGPISMNSATTATFQSLGATRISALGLMTVSAGGLLNISSQAKTNISSSVSTSIGGAKVNITSDGVLTVSSTGLATISGTAGLALNPPGVVPDKTDQALSIASAADALNSASTATGLLGTILSVGSSFIPPSVMTTTTMSTTSLPNRQSSGEAAQKPGSFSSGENLWSSDWYKAADINTIMARVPTHEPWDHHENIAPDKFTPDKLDATSNIG